MMNNDKESRKIVVQLLDIDGDVKLYNNVKFIKIKSEKYNLIIMEDYLPIIGELEGMIEIDFGDENLKLDNVKGYFMHKHNKFNLFYMK